MRVFYLLMFGCMAVALLARAADPQVTTSPATAVRFTAEEGKFYQLERSGADGLWKPWGDPVKGRGQVVTRHADGPAGTAVRYRVRTLAGQWVLVWRDEFNGTKLDTTRWAREENGYGGGNSEKQYYSSDPQYSRVRDGCLHLSLHRKPHTTPDGKTQPYTSARLRSLHRGDWRYGKFEVRAKVPDGEGLWPAVWMLPSESKYGRWAASGEIDILESRGRQVDKTIGSIHFGGPWPRNRHISKTYTFPKSNAAEAFHTYTVEWTKGKIQWFVDGVRYQTIRKEQWSSETAPDNPAAPFDQRFHLILNLAVDGNFFNGTGQNSKNVPDEKFPQVFQIDYVRVYQWAD